MSALRDAIVLKLQAASAVTAAATGGVYPGLPPEGSTFPFISVTTQSAPAALHNFQAIAAEDSIYLVKAIDQSISPKSVKDINALVRAALNRASISITGYTSLGCLWLQDVEYAEQQDGITYQHEGGLYSLMASAT